jgi:hypothetical protein
VQIATERLLLRPFTPDDAPAVQRLVSAYEIAENTLLIPHPYPDGVPGGGGCRGDGCGGKRE